MKGYEGERGRGRGRRGGGDESSDGNHRILATPWRMRFVITGMGSPATSGVGISFDNSKEATVKRL